MGSRATWNSQASLGPDTSPGRRGRGKGSDTSSGRMKKEAPVRQHPGLKTPQELVGLGSFQERGGRQTELEGYARKARTGKRDWRPRDPGLGFSSEASMQPTATREPYSFCSPAPDPGASSVQDLLASEVSLPPGCKPWPL